MQEISGTVRKQRMVGIVMSCHVRIKSHFSVTRTISPHFHVIIIIFNAQVTIKIINYINSYCVTFLLLGEMNSPDDKIEMSLTSKTNPHKEQQGNLGGPKSKGSSTREIVDEFVGNTTTHGVPLFLSRDRPALARMFWLVVTTGLLAVLLFQGSRLIISFFQWPSTTKTTLVAKSSLAFPAVTLCNLNMMRRSELKGKRFIVVNQTL